jgi:hypothetical protein
VKNEKEIKRWWNRFTKCIKDMPEGVELVVDGDNQASLYKSGALHDRHLGSEMDGWGITEEELHSGRIERVYPFGEGQ